MREVVIVSSVRTPVGRAFKGTLRATRPDELAAIAIKGALERVPQVDPEEKMWMLARGPKRSKARMWLGSHRYAPDCRLRFRRSPSTASARPDCRQSPWLPRAS